MAPARIATEAGYEPRERLWNFYHCLPEDDTGQVPDMTPLSQLDIGPVDHRWRDTEEKLLAVFNG